MPSMVSLARGETMTIELTGSFPADPAEIADRREFGTALTFLRERAGYTIRDIARTVGIPTATVGDYFAGRTLPPVRAAEVLPGLLRVCGVDDESALEEWLIALVR